MLKRIKQVLFVCVVAFLCYNGYISYKSGYYKLPDLPENAYPISFKNGLRAILIDPEVTDDNIKNLPQFFRRLATANPERRYLGIPLEIEPWFEDVWSWCAAPTEEEVAGLEQLPEDQKRQLQNARFDAVCYLDVDGKRIPRGLVFSVPNL